MRNSFVNSISDTDFELPFKCIEVLEDICIHVIDVNRRTIYYSKGCEAIEQYRKEDIVGKDIRDIYMLNEKSDLDDENSIVLKVLKTGKPIKDKTMKYITKKGKIVNVISSAYPLYVRDKLIGSIAVFRDVTQIMEMSSTIEKLQNVLFLQEKLHVKNGTQYYFQDIVGSSSIIKRTISMAKKMSCSTSPILIVGETGTGKELFAQGIHNSSPVREGPFVAINCSAIPETLLESILFGTVKGAFTGSADRPGLFEEATNGTLFLDELNSMNLILQSKLLRALESKVIRRVGSNNEIAINARIISATNINPLDLVEKKQFREDLYYRLAVLTLEIPALRSRPEDIDELVMSFIQTNNKIVGKNIIGITDKASKMLKNYNWPGNVRQLKHTIDYSMNVAEINDILIDTEHIPDYIVEITKNMQIRSVYRENKSGNLKTTMEEIERTIIIEKIKKNNGNLSKSAKELGISRQHLQYRLKALCIREFLNLKI